MNVLHLDRTVIFSQGSLEQLRPTTPPSFPAAPCVSFCLFPSLSPGFSWFIGVTVKRNHTYHHPRLLGCLGRRPLSCLRSSKLARCTSLVGRWVIGLWRFFPDVHTDTLMTRFYKSKWVFVCICLIKSLPVYFEPLGSKHQQGCYPRLLRI